MQPSTIEDIQTIIKGSYAVDQIRKDVKTFLMILSEEDIPQGWDNTVDLGTIGKGNWRNHLKVTFLPLNKNRVVVYFKTPGCAPDEYKLPGDTLPAHVAVDIYQLLPKLFDSLKSKESGLGLDRWGIPLYRKALSLI